MVKWLNDRISFEDENRRTTIVIRPIRVLWKEILLFLWVVSFTFVGIAMLYLLLTNFEGLNYDVDPTQDDRDNQIIYGIVFMGFWAYFEYKTVKSLLWYRFGKELILIDRDHFSLKKSIFSYGKAHQFFFENMKNVHQLKQEDTSFNTFFENAYWAIGTDSIGFDYHGKRKTFGRRLDEKSGKSLLKLIDDRVKKRLRERRKSD